MAISDKILAITEELAKTQKNNTFSALVLLSRPFPVFPDPISIH